jgi:hypothetical protein
MTMSILRRFRKSQTGAVLVEHTLVFLLLMLLTFGLIEFGVVLYQYNAAETATAVGARYVATRGPIAAGRVTARRYCAAGNSAAPSTAVRPGQSPVTRTRQRRMSSSPTDALVLRMQRFDPNIEAQNVQVVLRGAGLGFVGRGSPVPMVTVRLTGMQYDFIALDDLLGFGALTMPGFDATVVGEDLNGAGA